MIRASVAALKRAGCAIHALDPHPGRGFLAAGATLRAHFAGSLGCGSRWTTCRAWSRSAHRPRQEGWPLRDVYSSIFPGRREPLLCPESSRPPEVAPWSVASSRWVSSPRSGRAKGPRAALRPPSYESVAARERRRDPPPRLPPRARRAFRASPGAASMPACGSPNSAKRLGTVSTVKSAGSQSGTSCQ